jgi:hypothetical protein
MAMQKLRSHYLYGAEEPIDGFIFNKKYGNRSSLINLLL